MDVTESYAALEDYAAIVKQPMNFDKVLANVNESKYATVEDFLRDVELIADNAIQYNPDTGALCVVKPALISAQARARPSAMRRWTCATMHTT